MTYYKLNTEVRTLDNNMACFMPNNIKLATEYLYDGVFSYDMGLINWFRGQYGNEMKDKVFVDIGTNYGPYLMSLYDIFKHSYGFEPNKHTYNIACANMALYDASYKTTLYNCGLSDKVESLKYAYVDEFGGGNMFVKNEENDVSNTLIHSLDDYRKDYRHYEYMDVKILDDFNIENIGLIKIDVEGFELNVLKGGENTLKNSNYPMLIIESWDVKDDDNDEIKRAKTTLRNDLFSYLENLGYKGYDCGANNYFFIQNT